MPDKKILVVDDEPHVVKTLTFVLQKEGYEVATAVNGEEALNKVRQDKPSLMFLDVMMPKKNGYEVCQEIKSDSSLHDIHVAMLSAKGQEADKTTGLKVGANEYLTKPVDRTLLLEKVTSLLAG